MSRSLAAIAAVLAALALVPIWFHDSRSMMTVIVTGLLFCAYTIAFNIIFGATGQLFLCVGALAGIGGFGSVILSDRLGIPFVISIVVAGLVAGLFGALLSWIAVSRSLDTIFTGIVTLAFSLAYENFVLGRSDLTGGDDGLRVTAGSDSILDQQVAPYYVFLALVGVYLVIFLVIKRSHIGWAFQALRDDEVAAGLAGIDVARYKVYAGFIGSTMLGTAGAMFAHYRGFIGTSTYAFGNVDVRVLVMLALGGIGSLVGPIIGAVVFTVLDEILVDYAQLREILYGIITITLFLFFRSGIAPTVTSWWNQLRSPADPGGGGGLVAQSHAADRPLDS